MNVAELKAAVMFQTNNDTDDLDDFMPSLMDYLNDGYDRLVVAWAGVHPEETRDDYKPLVDDDDVPALPSWTHGAIADWATWLVYRNGNQQKQNRGYPFRSSFDDMVGRIRAEGGAGGAVRKFYNIPR